MYVEELSTHKCSTRERRIRSSSHFLKIISVYLTIRHYIYHSSTAPSQQLYYFSAPQQHNTTLRTKLLANPNTVFFVFEINSQLISTVATFVYLEFFELDKNKKSCTLFLQKEKLKFHTTVKPPFWIQAALFYKNQTTLRPIIVDSLSSRDVIQASNCYLNPSGSKVRTLSFKISKNFTTLPSPPLKTRRSVLQIFVAPPTPSSPFLFAFRRSFRLESLSHSVWFKS